MKRNTWQRKEKYTDKIIEKCKQYGFIIDVTDNQLMSFIDGFEDMPMFKELSDGRLQISLYSGAVSSDLWIDKEGKHSMSVCIGGF